MPSSPCCLLPAGCRCSTAAAPSDTLRLPAVAARLTRYTMRSLNRYDGRSGGVWSVASPDSAGITCRPGKTAGRWAQAAAAAAAAAPGHTRPPARASVPLHCFTYRLHIQPPSCRGGAPPAATAAAARCSCCWPTAASAAQLRRPHNRGAANRRCLHRGPERARVGERECGAPRERLQRRLLAAIRAIV